MIITKILHYIFNKITSHENILVLIFDSALLCVVILSFSSHIILLFSFILDKMNNIYYVDNLWCFMNVNETSSTNTTIIHSNDGWAQGIKSIFIYSTGALRLHLLRGGGTPLQKSFVISSTVVADAASTALKNAINDPEYVEKHLKSWKRIWNGGDSVTFHVDSDSDTLSNLKKIKSNLIPDDLNELSESLLNSMINYLKPILEPVSVNYSNEILSNQIYGISIILFILSILIIILLIAFISNIIIFVYTDKLINLFTNKYIRWYISFNKKIIGIEICCIGFSLLYFMFYLSYGIHFIATHPIIFS